MFLKECPHRLSFCHGNCPHERVSWKLPTWESNLNIHHQSPKFPPQIQSSAFITRSNMTFQSQSLATDMRRLFYSTWPPSLSSHIKKEVLSNRGGERRWPQNKTGVVHRYQATVISMHVALQKLRQDINQCLYSQKDIPYLAHGWAMGCLLLVFWIKSTAL